MVSAGHWSSSADQNLSRHSLLECALITLNHIKSNHVMTCQLDGVDKTSLHVATSTLTRPPIELLVKIANLYADWPCLFFEDVVRNICPKQCKRPVALCSTGCAFQCHQAKKQQGRGQHMKGSSHCSRW